jgi:hypothetical protein
MEASQRRRFDVCRRAANLWPYVPLLCIPLAQQPQRQDEQRHSERDGRRDHALTERQEDECGPAGTRISSRSGSTQPTEHSAEWANRMALGPDACDWT